MARTFTSEPINARGRHECRTERGVYLMGPSWIDTTAPRDMMDYDFTASLPEMHAQAAERHRTWCKMQAGQN